MSTHELASSHRSRAHASHRRSRAFIRLFLSSTLILAPSLRARGRLLDDDAPCDACAWSDDLARHNAPVDLVRVVSRVEAEYAGCGLSEFFERVRYDNATFDFIVAFEARERACAMTNASLSSRMNALAPARRMLWHAEMLERHLSVCRTRDESTARLREMASEAHRVVASGSCFEATTRILTTDFYDRGGGGVRTLAEDVRRNLYRELNAVDAGSMMYIERAFISNETLARAVPVIFAAFDACRTEGRFWSSPVPEDAFEALRAHYSTLDFLLTRSLVDREASGARTFAFLVNAAYDALRDADSCSESQKTLPGRFFVSDVFDAILSELARECGLAFVGLRFLDEYTRGQGSRLISHELRSIARYVAACDDANATSAKSMLFALNEGAVSALIAGLDAIHASLVGCRRGRRDETTAGRVAAGLRNALQRLREGGCYFASESGVAALLVTRATREAADSTSSQWSSPTTPTTPVRTQTPTVSSMILTAALTASFITVATLMMWTALCACHRRWSESSATTTLSQPHRAREGRYQKFFDDIDESTEQRDESSVAAAKARSPTTERRRARRSSFCLADAPTVRRSKSLEPNAHAHFS